MRTMKSTREDFDVYIYNVAPAPGTGTRKELSFAHLLKDTLDLNNCLYCRGLACELVY